MTVSVAEIARALANPDAPPRKKPGQPEFRLQCAVADRLRFLAMPDVFWTALPFGEHRSLETGKRLKRMGVIPGCPDILAIKDGRAFGFELKTEKDEVFGIARGYLSPEQKAVQTAWEAAGGKYILCRGYDAAVDALEIHGIIRPDRSFRKASVERVTA